ncbi:hypothetical protein NE237_016960 [Protea cynaroides]|uniref:adenine phosphoribosyltransferase n=1 Tax=Protea cynaroides TaxID=273540 RepID=A0A9Q0HH75_9MAGN|nr:hypothetical protein NE237_016960 [Protea cynaroides]
MAGVAAGGHLKPQIQRTIAQRCKRHEITISAYAAAPNSSSFRDLNQHLHLRKRDQPNRGGLFRQICHRPNRGGLFRQICHSAYSFNTKAEMASKDDKDQRLATIASTIRVIPDFPKPGIIFQDITTLLLNPKAFKDTIDLFVERYRGKDISVVAGIEARGFIFGPPIALAIGAKFVPMRKPNRLPGEVISEEYSLEYGKDIMEMHVGAVQAGEHVLVIDDLIATGGSLCAAIRLLERVGAEVVECACVIELPELKGRDRLGDKPLFVLVNAA